MNKQIRILHIAANAERARIVRGLLRHDLTFMLETALDEFEASLLLKEQHFDVALLSLPATVSESQSPNLSDHLTFMQRARGDMPLILVGEQMDPTMLQLASDHQIQDVIPLSLFDATQVCSSIRFVVQKHQVMQITPPIVENTVTGLPSKVVLQDQLEHAITKADRHNSQVVLGLFQLDKLPDYIDTHGDHLGHAIQAKAAELMQSVLPEDTLLCDLDDGRFAVVLEEIDSVASATAKMDAVIGTLSRRRAFDQHRLRLSASCGIAFYPQSESQKGLQECAEEALFRASRAGGNRYKVYTENMSEEALWKYHLDRDLKRALERDEFVLHYQPIIDFQTGKPTRLEALLRWQHPEAGLLFPNAFIEHLETLEMIRDVGEWILKLATRQLKSWQDMGQSLTMDVNISREQLTDPTFVARVDNALRLAGVEPQFLELELTERQHIPQHDVVSHQNIHALVEMGVQFAIDDYGVGHSSDEYLRRFPPGTFSTLKVDRSYVENITENPTDAACVKRDIDFAHDLGLRVIAEGIETVEQLELIRSLGADAMQGYLVSKPLAAPRLADCLWRNEFDLNRFEATHTSGVG